MYLLLNIVVRSLLFTPPSAAVTANIAVSDSTITTPAPKAGAAWQSLYDSARLEKSGLRSTVFQKVYKGYQKMVQCGLIGRSNLLTICDFSQSSRQKRLYVVNLTTFKLVLQTHVAHGQGSGDEYARKFSNAFDSHQSSLGFYTTLGTYTGEHGYSLRLRGCEPGFNDNALARDVVIHGADYVSESIARSQKKIGRSWGCPAVAYNQHEKLINLIKNGTCLFVYHPTVQYLKKSKLLN
jgi:hypothetical protein